MTQNSAKYELYKRIKLLGQGSFGKAFLVQTVSEGSYCVIKQFDLSTMSESEKQSNLNEAKVLEALKHPNIIRFREVYKTKRGKLCIVMDYADGGDLSAKIKAQKGQHFPEDQIIDWFTQICLGLKHVHDRKILHRDLKAQNVFLTKNNMIKLGDFGIARVLSGTEEKARTVVGTPYYLSPEIIDERPYDFKSDVWSLGILLYELCALRPPFDAKNLPLLLRRISKGQYSPLPSIYSKELRDLVDKLLRVNPSERPSINSILRMPLIQDRIRRFLNETAMMEEFAHTALHNQQFANNDLKFENIKNVINEIPIPQHLLKVQVQSPFRPQRERSPHSNKKITPSKPNSQQRQLKSPALQPIMHQRKSPSSSPIITSNQLNIDPVLQIKSPMSALRQLRPMPRPNLPPLYSPQLQAGQRSPALVKIDTLRPLFEKRPQLNPKEDGGLISILDSPRYNLQKLPTLERNMFRDSQNLENQTPNVILPSLTSTNGTTEPSPNLKGRVLQPKVADNQVLPKLNPVKGINSAEKPLVRPNPSKIGVKRDILKGFDNCIPDIKDPDTEAMKPRDPERKGSGTYSKKKDTSSPENDQENSEIQSENGENGSDSKRGGNRQNMLYKNLVKELKKDNLLEDEDEEDRLEQRKKGLIKNYSQEIKDIEAMVQELNVLVSNLGNEGEQNVETPNRKNSKPISDELSDQETNDDKNEDREDDDFDEPQPNEKDEINNQKKEKENDCMPDIKGLESLRVKLEEGLGQEKFKQAYNVAKNLVDKDEDVNLNEEKTEHYCKMFPFLSAEDIESHLFTMFTYVVMEDWLTKKSIKS